jgi:hypothetical protein
MAGPYTRKAWNELIDRVNDLCENPPEDTDCEPIEPLEHVDPEHIWTTGDIDEVRQKLMEICKDNEFEEELDLWRQKTIDEIEEAISAGWCDCEEDDECSADIEDTILYSAYDRYVFPVVALTCGESSSLEECIWGRDSFDYYSIGTAVTGYDEGIGGWVRIRRYVTRPSGSAYFAECYFNYFNCDGSQREPLPPARYDSSGDLRDSAMATEIVTCLRCSPYVGWVWTVAPWLSFCGCTKCHGYVRCCSNDPNDPPHPSPCFSAPACSCSLDEGFVRNYYGNPEDHDENLIQFIQRKHPIGLWQPPRKCRVCCSDGIGWCDRGECPAGDPECGEDYEPQEPMQ